MAAEFIRLPAFAGTTVYRVKRRRIMEQLCPIGFDDLDHIASKVRNAYQYATGDAGEKSFAAALEKVDREDLDFSQIDKEEGLFDE